MANTKKRNLRTNSVEESMTHTIFNFKSKLNQLRGDKGQDDEDDAVFFGDDVRDTQRYARKKKKKKVKK